MDATSSQPEAKSLASDSPAWEKPSRLILYAFGWMLAAEVASGFAAFTYSFINTASGNKTGVPSYIAYPACALATQLVILLSALHRGHIMAEGASLRVALGNLPLRRWWPLIGTGLFLILWTGMFAWAQFVHPRPVPSSYAIDLTSALATGGWATTIVVCLVSLVLAPIGEELFFRGWLWEGLRKSWRPVPVMLGTSLPWLFIHALDTGMGSLALIPEAVCFCLVRHFCGSVRASIALHVLNNLIAVGSLVWFFKGPR